MTCVLLQQYVRNLKNFRAEQPHQHAVYYTNALAAEQFWTKDELLEATEGSSFERVIKESHRQLTGVLYPTRLRSFHLTPMLLKKHYAFKVPVL